MPKQKILIVEDEAVVARHLEQSLSDRGYEVAVANTGEKAVQYAAESLPDLVLVDIVLPGTVDGIKAAEQFVRSNVPVIYMTGHAESDLFDRARHTEPLAYLSKPLRMGELTRAIDLALFKRGRDVERELQTRQQAGALRASEERFRRLVEGVADYAIFTLDVSGRVNSWNAGAWG